jgi:hypothetical protein
MGVVFKGGTSGNRADALPPVPSSGSSQPVLSTETSGAVPSTVHLDSDKHRPHASSATPDFMPTGGGTGSGTDISDPTATTGGDPSVFESGAD